MRKIYFLLAMVIIVTGLSTCTQSKNIPDWVLNPPVNADAFYGIGNAKSTDSKNPSKLAEEKAAVSAVFMAQFKLSEMFEDTEELVFEETYRSIQMDWAVSDIEIKKREQTSDGTWWCLAVYKR